MASKDCLPNSSVDTEDADPQPEEQEQVNDNGVDVPIVHIDNGETGNGNESSLNTYTALSIPGVDGETVYFYGTNGFTLDGHDYYSIDPNESLWGYGNVTDLGSENPTFLSINSSISSDTDSQLRVPTFESEDIIGGNSTNPVPCLSLIAPHNDDVDVPTAATATSSLSVSDSTNSIEDNSAVIMNDTISPPSSTASGISCVSSNGEGVQEQADVNKDEDENSIPDNNSKKPARKSRRNIKAKNKEQDTEFDSVKKSVYKPRGNKSGKKSTRNSTKGNNEKKNLTAQIPTVVVQHMPEKRITNAAIDSSINGPTIRLVSESQQFASLQQPQSNDGLTLQQLASQDRNAAINRMMNDSATSATNLGPGIVSSVGGNAELSNLGVGVSMGNGIGSNSDENFMQQIPYTSTVQPPVLGGLPSQNYHQPGVVVSGPGRLDEFFSSRIPDAKANSKRSTVAASLITRNLALYKQLTAPQSSNIQPPGSANLKFIQDKWMKCPNPSVADNNNANSHPQIPGSFRQSHHSIMQVQNTTLTGLRQVNGSIASAAAILNPDGRDQQRRNRLDLNTNPNNHLHAPIEGMNLQNSARLPCPYMSTNAPNFNPNMMRILQMQQDYQFLKQRLNAIYKLNTQLRVRCRLLCDENEALKDIVMEQRLMFRQRGFRHRSRDMDYWTMNENFMHRSGFPQYPNQSEIPRNNYFRPDQRQFDRSDNQQGHPGHGYTDTDHGSGHFGNSTADIHRLNNQDMHLNNQDMHLSNSAVGSERSETVVRDQEEPLATVPTSTCITTATIKQEPKDEEENESESRGNDNGMLNEVASGSSSNLSNENKRSLEHLESSFDDVTIKKRRSP